MSKGIESDHLTPSHILRVVSLPGDSFSLFLQACPTCDPARAPARAESCTKLTAPTRVSIVFKPHSLYFSSAQTLWNSKQIVQSNVSHRCHLNYMLTVFLYVSLSFSSCDLSHSFNVIVRPSCESNNNHDH